MQNTVTLSPAMGFVNSAAEAVVKSDAGSTGIPSIKLETLKANVSVSTDSAPAKPSPAEAAAAALASMEQARNSWETTELAASNKRLYSILQEAYSYYLVMKGDASKDVREARMQQLERFIAERGYKFQPSTHDMTRVVKCVFGMDRRRVSAYSIALREALRQKVTAADLTEFIEENGGVEQIRMGGTKPLSASIRAERVKDEVVKTDLGLLKFDARLLAADADWTDKQVVIVATYLPTGEFQANAVIRHDTAVNAALAAYYSKRKAEEQSRVKAERDAEKEAAAAAKKAAYLEREKAAMLKKEEAMKRQIAGVIASQADAKQSAANAKHLDSLLEVQPA